MLWQDVFESASLAHWEVRLPELYELLSGDTNQFSPLSSWKENW